ncbi:MAG: MBL fold metallo-hydrolase [Chloroflexi bacterium]|nr:MBL fold metallo-hydrolase [Chloroflexota bacterium]
MTEVALGVEAITLRPDDDNSPHVYWVRGTDGGVLIDAGHGEDQDVAQLVTDEIDRLRGAGPAPHTLLITDRFDEHCGGFPALRDAFPGMTVHAGTGDAEAIEETAGAPLDGRLGGGETFTAAGEAPRTVRAVATTGHTGGSMCYLLEPDGVLFSGDCVLSTGSTAVHLDLGGDMAAYVRSLHTLAGLDARLLLSFHGAPVTDPAAKLAELIAHREARDESILECLRDGVTDLDAMRDRLYGEAGLDEWRWNAARDQIRGHLIKLAGEGHVVEVEAGTTYRLP